MVFTSSRNKSSIRHISYSVILFISLFMLIYPEQYIFFPVSTIWFVHLLGVIIYFLYYSKLPKSSAISIILLYAFVIAVTGLLASYIFNDSGDLGLAKRGFQIILYIFDAFWIIYLLKKVEGYITFYALLKWLVYIAIIQAIISFVFFLYPPSYGWYNSLIIMRFDEDKAQLLNSLRLMSVGDMRYATAAVHYGFMMWAVILLRKIGYSIVGKKSLLFSSISTLFVIAGLLSGRTFFIFLLFTIPFLYFLYDCNFFFTLRQFWRIYFPVIIIAIFAFVYLLAENEEMISWAFELFINLSEGGALESASTNDLKSMYIFPENISTWIIGDGKTTNPYGGFYMDTDVGYLRSLFYWGIVGSCIYFIIQFKLYRLVLKLTNDKNIRRYCLFIVFWLFVYFFKDLFSIEKLMVLFIMTLIYSYPKNFIYRA